MVEFIDTLRVVTSFIANILNLSFFGFGTFGTVVLIFLLLSLVGFVLRGLWDGGEK